MVDYMIHYAIGELQVVLVVALILVLWVNVVEMRRKRNNRKYRYDG